MAFIRRLFTSLPHKPNLFSLPYTPPPPRGQNVPRRLFSEESLSHRSNPIQIYISRSSDPYLNLSIEHYLLEKSRLGSVVLFLYANRPCVVIGRNQNPWVEVNLGLLRRQSVVVGGGDGSRTGVQLVRRRSGGGTVFHDAGNVNYSVICPSNLFDRDRHAAMVARALSSLSPDGGVPRVNERHDIVLDVAAPPSSAAAAPQTFKVSGSAYKLTRLRSLHHGTCLLCSPNLHLVAPLLRSPAAPYIKANGVESVPSPIRNVGLPIAAFEEAVVAEFCAMYEEVEPAIISEQEAAEMLRDIPAVAKGYAELKSPEWIYAQTPQFTFATHPTNEDPRDRPPPPNDLARDFRATMTVRHGKITHAYGPNLPNLLESLKSTYLHRVTDWRSKLDNRSAGKWLNELFGVGEND